MSQPILITITATSNDRTLFVCYLLRVAYTAYLIEGEVLVKVEADSWGTTSESNQADAILIVINTNSVVLK